jgi:hypothetical protein
MADWIPTYLGGTQVLTTHAVVGTPEVAEVYVPGTEELTGRG